MAQGINLLPDKTERESFVVGYKKKVNVVAIASLLFVAVIFLTLFAYQLFLQTSRSRVENQAVNAQDQIQTQQTKEISQRALVDKLTEIDRLLNQAVPSAEAVSEIRKVAKSSGNISIERLSIKSDGDLIFGGSTRSTLNIQKLFKDLIASEALENFADVSLESLSKEEGEPFVFTLNMDFKPRGLDNK